MLRHILTCVLLAFPLAAQPPRTNVQDVTTQPISVQGTTAPQAGEIPDEVLAGLASMRVAAVWWPDVGVPVYRDIAIVQQPRRREIGEQVLYEDRTETDIEITGLAGVGEVTIRVWSWVRPGWMHTEHWLEVANDSPVRPCGGIPANGHWRFVIYTPGGYALPRGDRPYMLESAWPSADQTERFSLQLEFPRVDLADGCYRGAGVVVGWGRDAVTTAHTKAAVPDHGAIPGAIGTLWRVDEARGRTAALQAAQARAQWLMRVERDPYATWGNRLSYGQSGDDRALFGQLPIPGLQEGGSDLAADHAILVQLAVEGRRPTWLDWEEMRAAGKDYFVPPRRGETYNDFGRIHRFAAAGFGRGSWTDAEYGDEHGWDGPNAEHRFQASLFQLAGLTLHPVVRDKALQYAARAACSCGLAAISENGYYGGGNKADLWREWCRQLSCVAMGYLIADRWGMVDLAAQFSAHLSRKWERAVTEPGGYRTAVGNDGTLIPWANTPLSWGSNGRLSLDDIRGTEFDREPYLSRLEWVNTKAWWQTNQLGPQVIWALRTQDRNALIGLRDAAFQLLSNVLGPVSDPTNLSDPRTLRIPKFGHSRVLGLGHGWQTPGDIPPMGHNQVIELWPLETATWMVIFAGHGIDTAKAAAYRAGLLAFHPDFAWGQWGCAPPEDWVAYAARYGPMPDLGPLPVHTSVLGPR